MRVVNERLLQCRLKAGLTQGELSELTGITQSSLSRAERGGKGLSKKHMEAAAEVLNVPVGYLTGQDMLDDEMLSRHDIQLRGDSPTGLQALANDNHLCDELVISDDEWRALWSLELPLEIQKVGYIHILCSIRFALQHR